MRESLFETLVGFVVVAVAAIFLFFSLQQRSDATTGNSYVLTAQFPRADGIDPGTDVRMAGVKIGTVTSKKLDQSRYTAEVRMSIENGVLVPDDSVAQIQADSLLGGSYIHIMVGGSDATLPTNGDGKFDYTRGSIDIFGQVLEALGNAGGGGEGGGGSAEEALP